MSSKFGLSVVKIANFAKHGHGQTRLPWQAESMLTYTQACGVGRALRIYKTPPKIPMVSMRTKKKSLN